MQTGAEYRPWLKELRQCSEVSFSTQSQGKFPMFFVFYDVARNSYDAALVI